MSDVVYKKARHGYYLRGSATSHSNEALLKSLNDDANDFYLALDNNDDATVFNQSLHADDSATPEESGPQSPTQTATVSTIYMVSDRPDYFRSNPIRFGVREVTVNNLTRDIVIDLDEINEVPCVQGENLLLFVHGFNNSAADAALAAWRLGNDLQGIDKTVFFSWPSAADITSYLTDYQSAFGSVHHVVQCIKELASCRPRNVHIVAHSMGCRLLTMALIKYITLECATKLVQIYFIAGDVDQDVFLTSMKRIAESRLVTNLNNIASNHDYALHLSKRWHRKNRSGLYPPVVSCSNSPPSFTSLLRPYPLKGNSHGYYNSANVRADISNQVVLHHTNAVPKPEDIRTTNRYRKIRGVSNTFAMRVLHV